MILIKWVKRKRHRPCTVRKRARTRLESAGYQHSLSCHPHCFPSDIPAPESWDSHTGQSHCKCVAAQRLPTFLGGNNMLQKSLPPASLKICIAVCFKRPSHFHKWDSDEIRSDKTRWICLFMYLERGNCSGREKLEWWQCHECAANTSRGDPWQQVAQCPGWRRGAAHPISSIQQTVCCWPAWQEAAHTAGRNILQAEPCTWHGCLLRGCTDCPRHIH